MKFLKVLFIYLFITLSFNLFSQQEGRIPKYPIPYTLPRVDSIKTLCLKVKNYCIEQSPLEIYDRKTNEIITDFSEPNKNATVRKGLFTEWTYTNGVVVSACDYLYDVTGDESYIAYNTRFYDFIYGHFDYFAKNYKLYGRKSSGWRRIFEMEALDHCGSIGAGLVRTYMRTENEKYRPLIDTVDQFIMHEQFRLDDGTLARHRPQAVSVWADDMYMGVSFIAAMAALTNDQKYYDDAARNIVQMADRLFIEKEGLFDHGWNECSADYDPHFFWARANGWTLMAMADLLSILPEGHKDRERILHIYRSLTKSLAEWQDGTGFWHNMINKTDTYLETSATAMFTYAIARGINEGWINHVYGPVAIAGWNAIQTVIDENGAVDGTCEGTTFAHDNVYYYNRGASIYATHGYGPVLFAGAEMIKLLGNNKIKIINVRPNSINSTFHFVPNSNNEIEK